MYKPEIINEHEIKRKQLDEAFYVVVEGVDGSGKSTFTTELYNELTLLGYKCLKTREPHSCEAEQLKYCDNIEKIDKYAVDRISWQKRGIPEFIDIVIQGNIFLGKTMLEFKDAPYNFSTDFWDVDFETHP